MARGLGGWKGRNAKGGSGESGAARHGDPDMSYCVDRVFGWMDGRR